jgi:sporulation protein YlmC with PRC-barrel domain
MLWTASGINGYAIIATDGHIGSVSDFLFDDETWQVRWLVVDPGNWLSGRKILLPPSALGHPDPEKHEFSVRLSKQQIQDSPSILSDRPVSRQDETNIYGYYGWRPYWGSGFFMGGYGYTGDDWIGSDSPGSVQREREVANSRLNDGDPHLRSVEAVTGYHIHATDGEVGHVEDFLLEDTDWSIHYFVVDTRNWWPGKHVLISPGSAGTIDWSDRLVNLNVDRQKVKDSPEYDAATTVDQAYERRFHEYYRGVRARGPY